MVTQFVLHTWGLAAIWGGGSSFSHCRDWTFLLKRQPQCPEQDARMCQWCCCISVCEVFLIGVVCQTSTCVLTSQGSRLYVKCTPCAPLLAHLVSSASPQNQRQNAAQDSADKQKQRAPLRAPSPLMLLELRNGAAAEQVDRGSASMRCVLGPGKSLEMHGRTAGGGRPSGATRSKRWPAFQLSAEAAPSVQE